MVALKNPTIFSLSKNLKNKMKLNAMKGDDTAWFIAQNAAPKTKTPP